MNVLHGIAVLLPRELKPLHQPAIKRAGAFTLRARVGIDKPFKEALTFLGEFVDGI